MWLGDGRCDGDTVCVTGSQGPIMAAPPPLGSSGSPTTLSHAGIRSPPVASHLGAGVSGPGAWAWQLPGLGTYVDLRQGTLGDPGPAGLAWLL